MKQPSFEESLKKVEEAVRSLEGGNLSLEDSLKSYEEGLQSLRRCCEILDAAEKQVTMLSKNVTGDFIQTPFFVEKTDEARMNPGAKKKISEEENEE